MDLDRETCYVKRVQSGISSLTFWYIRIILPLKEKKNKYQKETIMEIENRKGNKTSARGAIYSEWARKVY